MKSFKFLQEVADNLKEGDLILYKINNFRSIDIIKKINYNNKYLSISSFPIFETNNMLISYWGLHKYNLSNFFKLSK